ncbi:Cd(II)/Pb(II)-responsive transcriptional regulator [Hydrogenophaga sp. 5NK40-0174]|uniref:Cd(II)/Pb(II)-responsive transcriptional regulator n=1 Tax=Hydrogenophaga sp. 5NK40-0174 TaxID=3127649 RepID=UPI0031021E2B
MTKNTVEGDGPTLTSQAYSSSPAYRIGVAARRSGVDAANIRYYEREGLLRPQARADNQYRLYSDADVHCLRFIRLCRAMDMSLDEVRSLMGLRLDSKSDCETARQTLDAHLGHVRQRLKELKALERDLVGLRDRCDGTDGHCHIIEALHDQADALLSKGSNSTARKRGHV